MLVQTRYYLSRVAKGEKFDCTSCRETKCLFKGPVEIEAYWLDKKTGKREKIRINNEDELFAYVDRAKRKLFNEGVEVTEFDLVYAGSCHRICPVPLFDKETLNLMQFLDLSGEVSPLDVPRLPVLYVSLKSIVDSETVRMERKYAPRHDNPDY